MNDDIFNNIEDEDVLYEFKKINSEHVTVHYAGWLLIDYDIHSVQSYMTKVFDESDYEFICVNLAKTLNVNINHIKRSFKYGK